MDTITLVYGKESKRKKSQASFKWAGQLGFKIKYKIPFKYDANSEKWDDAFFWFWSPETLINYPNRINV